MGLQYHGHDCVYSVEYDSKAITAYKTLWGSKNCWFDDMRKLDYKDLPNFDILCAGFPCAKFSIAGDRQGFESDDPRATVFYELMKIAKIKKPRYLLFENVKGLLNHDEGRSLQAIIYEMDKLGYNVEWQVINAKEYGGNAIRERVFIIGHNRRYSTKKILPIKTTVATHDEKTLVYQYRRGNFRTFKGYAPTLTASMGTGGNNVPFIIDDIGVRKLTPKEMFRLQGIADKYIDKLLESGLPDSALYERAGRTVYIPIIREIGRRFKKLEKLHQ